MRALLILLAVLISGALFWLLANPGMESGPADPLERSVSGRAGEAGPGQLPREDGGSRSGGEAAVGEAAVLGLRGRVIDRTTRQPIEGAVVVATADSGRVWESAPTGEDGRFGLSGVPPGTAVTLRAEHPDHHAGWLRDGSTLEPVRVLLAPGEKRTDLLFELEALGGVEGWVRDSSGLGHAGVAIYAVPPDWSPVPGSDLDLPRLGQTADEGRFRLHELPTGRFRLVAERGLSPFGISDVLELQTGERVEIVIDLPDGAIVFGTVHDHTGRPLPDANVAIMPAEGLSAGAKTDIEGRYRVEDLRPGRYTAAVTPPGGTPGTSQLWSKSFDLYADVSELQVDLAPPAGGCHLRGQVTLRGMPVEGAQVTLLTRQIGDVFFGERFVAETDETGSYEIEGAPAGPAQIYVGSTERSIDTLVDVEIPEASDETIDIEFPASRVRGFVVPLGEVSNWEGFVVLSPALEDRAPMERALASDGGPLAEVREDGRFVIDAVPPGRYRPFVVSTQHGWSDDGNRFQGFQDFEVLPGQDIDLGPLELEEAQGTFEVVARGWNGEPLPKAEVVVRQEGIDVPALDSRGIGPWRRRLLPPGEYSGWVIAEGYAPERFSELEIQAGEQRELVVDLQRGSRLSVTVVREGEPVADAVVEVVGVAGDRLPLPRSALHQLAVRGGWTTGPDGQVIIPHLAAGEYRVSVDGSGFEAKTITIESGRDRDLVLRGR